MSQVVSFLFWNINRRPLTEFIAKIAHDYDVDILMLAEAEIPEAKLLQSLNKGQRAIYMRDIGLSKRLCIYSRYHSKFLKPVSDIRGIAVRHLKPPIGKDILIFVVHLASKLYQGEEDQALFCTRLARLIDKEEAKVGHSRTVLVGDLNMNPFECGVIGAEGLHAVMDRRIASERSRVVQGEERCYFYNPMWSYLGDMSLGPPGTYFYNTGTQVNYFWNMFDQVLIRWELLGEFCQEELRVITKAGQESLLTDSGRPDKVVGSDHLPLFFRLNL